MAARRTARFRLTHDGAQPGTPLEEPLRFGLQDTKGSVHPGTPALDGMLRFDFAMDLREGAAGEPVLGGQFAHGPPAARFLYLGWKRQGEHAAPWGWRIKMPLAAIGWDAIRAAERPGHRVAADVTGRRPHATAPVSWHVLKE